jgi:putative ubiquitin-RnfH superfamily antitoxin RatB of RatAB toxin-antitoxin module
VNAATMRVEVAYAGPEGQWVIVVELPVGATLTQAIEASGIRRHIPTVAVGDGNVGVFSRPRRLDEALTAGDRVEIYRPLLADPKEQRRARARTRA